MRRMLYIQYANPAAYPPLQHSARLFARRGWRVLVLGVASHGTGALDWPPCEGVEFRLIRGTPRGIFLKLQYVAYALWVLYWSVRWRPTFVYASDPLSAPVANILHAVLGRPMIYHEHDSPPFRAGAGQALVTRARTRAARRARLCVLPNAARADAFIAATGIGREKLRCVWNCPSKEEARAVGEDAREDFVVYFHGSINGERLPTAVLDAIASLPGCVKFHFAGYETIGSQGYVERFLAHARALGIDAARVRFLGPGSRADVMRWAAECHAGLALMPMDSADINMRFMVGASNKPFDYMACGLALVVSRLPEWEEAFVAPGYAVACDPRDAASIAAALRPLIEDAPMRRRMARLSVERILADWNYERQFAPVLEEIDR